MSNKAISIALAALLWLPSYGDEQAKSIFASIEAGGSISVSQPAALDSLLQRPVATPAAKEETGQTPAAADTRSHKSKSGYRVQIFEDNNPLSARRTAESYHSRMQTEFPRIRSYISFNSPYWRVKAGDFRTRAEAEGMLAELKQAFPSLAPYMRIVRDKINIYD